MKRHYEEDPFFEGLACVINASAVRPEKPNIVLVLADDLGWQEVNCYDIDENNLLVIYPEIDEVQRSKDGFVK